MSEREDTIELCAGCHHALVQHSHAAGCALCECVRKPPILNCDICGKPITVERGRTHRACRLVYTGLS